MKREVLAANAKILKIAVWLFLVAFALAYAVGRLGLDLGDHVRILTAQSVPPARDSQLSSDVAVVLFLLSLLQLTRLLGRLARGELFTAAVARAFRRFALMLMLAALVSILGPIAAALVGGFRDDHRLIALAVNLRDVMFLISAFVLFLVARMLDAAAGIDSELREIV